MIWNNIKEVGIPKEFKEVVYVHSCGSKSLGRLGMLGNEVTAFNSATKPLPNYGYPIVAWMEIPRYEA